MIPIAKLNGTGVGGALSFTNIPNTFDHLQIRAYCRGTRSFTAEQFYVQFNGDTSTSYWYHYMYSDGGGAAPAAGNGNTTLFFVGEFIAGSTASGIYSPFIVDVFDYANASKNKTIKAISASDNRRDPAYAGKVWMTSGVYTKNDVINRIDVLSNGPFTTDSIVCLYGMPKVGS